MHHRLQFPPKIYSRRSDGHVGRQIWLPLDWHGWRRLTRLLLICLCLLHFVGCPWLFTANRPPFEIRQNLRSTTNHCRQHRRYLCRGVTHYTHRISKLTSPYRVHRCYACEQQTDVIGNNCEDYTNRKITRFVQLFRWIRSRYTEGDPCFWRQGSMSVWPVKLNICILGRVYCWILYLSHIMFGYLKITSECFPAAVGSSLCAPILWLCWLYDPCPGKERQWVEIR